MLITRTKHGQYYIINGFKVRPELFAMLINEFFTDKGVVKIMEQLDTTGYVIIEDRSKTRIRELEAELRELKIEINKQEAEVPF